MSSNPNTTNSNKLTTGNSIQNVATTKSLPSSIIKQPINKTQQGTSIESIPNESLPKTSASQAGASGFGSASSSKANER